MSNTRLWNQTLKENRTTIRRANLLHVVDPTITKTTRSRHASRPCHAWSSSEPVGAVITSDRSFLRFHNENVFFKLDDGPVLPIPIAAALLSGPAVQGTNTEDPAAPPER